MTANVYVYAELSHNMKYHLLSWFRRSGYSEELITAWRSGLATCINEAYLKRRMSIKAKQSKVPKVRRPKHTPMNIQRAISDFRKKNHSLIVNLQTGDRDIQYYNVDPAVYKIAQLFITRNNNIKPYDKRKSS